MTRATPHAPLRHPRATEVTTTDTRPREITVQFADGFEVELWPGYEDHGQQIAWIDTAVERLHHARQLMTDTPTPGEVEP